MPFVKDGLVYILLSLISGIVLIFIFLPAGIVLVLLTFFFAYFFRDPKRDISPDPAAVLSPCDGTVMEITQENNFKVVRSFLSVFNVHLQRAPVSGLVRQVVYTPGRFLPANNPNAHQVNENNVIAIASPKGDFEVKQIAGILARRVVSWVKQENVVEQGEKIGFIKFGSQVDIFMPQTVEIKVKVGDKVKGGLTVIGTFQK